MATKNSKAGLLKMVAVWPQAPLRTVYTCCCKQQHKRNNWRHITAWLGNWSLVIELLWQLKAWKVYGQALHPLYNWSLCWFSRWQHLSSCIKQTCLPQILLSVLTLNSLCPYFLIFDRIFFFWWMHHQSITTRQCQRASFLSSFKNSVWTHNKYRRTTKLAHYEHLVAFICFICESCSGSKTAEHFLQKQCTMCAAFTEANVSFPERLLSAQSLFPWFRACFLGSCSFPPLCRFCATTCHLQLRIQTCHSWRRLPSAGLAKLKNKHWPCGLVDLNFYSPTKKLTRPQVLSVIKTILKFKI